MVLRLIALMTFVASALHAQDTTKAQPPVRTKVAPAKAPVPAKTAPAKTPPQGDEPWARSVVPLQLGWLGFRTDPYDAGLIVEVAPDSPADNAGLRPGDRIVASDQLRATIRTPDTTRRFTATTRYERGTIVGRTYRMTVRRGEETFSVAMVAVPSPDGEFRLILPTSRPASNSDTLEAAARSYRTELQRSSLRATVANANRAVAQMVDSAGRARADSTATYTGSLRALRATDSAGNATVRFAVTEARGYAVGYRVNAVSGAEFEQLNPALGQYFNGITEGVFVLRVGPNSPAATAGLQPGDIVQSVNRTDVFTIAELRQAIAGETGPITLDIVRLGKPAIVTLRKE